MKPAEHCNDGLMIAQWGESPPQAATPTRRHPTGDLVVVEAQDGRRLRLTFVMLTGRH